LVDTTYTWDCGDGVDDSVVDIYQVCAPATTHFEYTDYGALESTYSREGSGTSWLLHRSKELYYAENTGLYIVNKPYLEITKDNVAATMTKSYFYYDGSTNYLDQPTKGNLTETRTWRSDIDNEFDPTATNWPSATMTYDSFGNLVSTTNVLGATSTITYDTVYNKFPESMCNDLSQCVTSVWNMILEEVASVTDTNGQTSTNTYDNLSRKTQTVRGGFQENWEYNDADMGDPEWQRWRHTVQDGSPNGLWVDLYYDGMGREYASYNQSSVDSDTRYYNITGRVMSKSLPYMYGFETSVTAGSFLYDKVGRRTHAYHEDLSFVETTYGVKNVTSTDEMGHQKTTFVDQVYGQIIQVDEIEGTSTFSTFYEYNGRGQLTKITDALSNESTFTWNSVGSKLTDCDPDRGCVTYVYDVGGRVLSATDASAQATSFTHDSLNRILTKTTADTAPAVTVTYTYDQTEAGFYNMGRLTSVVHPGGSEEYDYDEYGNLAKEIICVDTSCNTFQYAYDSLARKTSITYPDGEVVNYTYGTTGLSAGKLVTASGDANYVISSSYNSRDQISVLTSGNGVKNIFTYDWNRMWLTYTKIKTTGGPAAPGAFEAGYTYDLGGLVTGVSSTTHTDQNFTYVYDDLHRLTSTSGAQNETYSYDAIGNILNKSDVGSYTYGDTSHVHAVTIAGSDSYTYDTNGNMLTGAGRTFTWDSQDRMASFTELSDTTNYTYGAGEGRIKKVSPTETVKYFGLVDEVDGSLVKYYYFGKIRVAKTDSTGTYYYHADRLGSTKLITDSTKAVVRDTSWGAYGPQLSVTGSHDDDFGFTGHRLDSESGLTYMVARYYDETIGRFVSADTLIPDIYNPQALNRYSYAYNNPIMNTDPTGHGILSGIISMPFVIANSAIGILLDIAGMIVSPFLPDNDKGNDNENQDCQGGLCEDDVAEGKENLLALEPIEILFEQKLAQANSGGKDGGGSRGKDAGKDAAENTTLKAGLRGGKRIGVGAGVIVDDKGNKAYFFEVGPRAGKPLGGSVTPTGKKVPETGVELLSDVSLCGMGACISQDLTNIGAGPALGAGTDGVEAMSGVIIFVNNDDIPSARDLTGPVKQVAIKAAQKAEHGVADDIFRWISKGQAGAFPPYD